MGFPDAPSKRTSSCGTEICPAGGGALSLSDGNAADRVYTVPRVTHVGAHRTSYVLPSQ